MPKVEPQSFPMEGREAKDPEYGDYMALLKVAPTEEKAERLRSFPIPLRMKRALLEETKVKVSTSCTESCRLSCRKTRNKCENCSNSLELWGGQIRTIEGMFGAGVSSFFSLLRSLFFLNGCLLILFILFVIVPQGLNNSDSSKANMLSILSSVSSLAHSCSLTYAGHINNLTSQETTATKFLDFLSGTGWMEYTLMFFGGYFPVSTTVVSIAYYYPLAYMVIVGIFFLASIIMLLVFAGRSFKRSVLNDQNIGVSRYCNSVLGGWDYSLVNEKNAGLKTNMLYNEMMGNMKDDEHAEKLANMSSGRKCCLYTIRAIINILILGMLGGAGYLIYFVQVTSSSYTATNADAGSIVRLIMEYLPSITIAVIGAIYPLLFKFMVLAEDYSSETAILLTLIRIVFVKLFSVVVLMISLYTVITCSSQNTCNVGTGSCQAIYCWESYVGQQFYKLAITQFLVFLIVTFGVEGLRALIVKKCHCKLSEIIGLPQFDIPKCVLDLIYVQILTWFGSFFCPVLPIITTTTLFILFYLKLFACHFCYKPDEVPFKASRANFFFLLVLIFAYFLCILPIGYCIVKIPTSKGCGPFRTFTTMYEVIPATINAWPQWAQTLFQWLGSAAFVALIFIILLIIIYYYSTLASTRLAVNRRLRGQVNAETRSKQKYFRQLVDAGITPSTKKRGTPAKKDKGSPTATKNEKNDVSKKPPATYEHDGWE